MVQVWARRLLIGVVTAVAIVGCSSAPVPVPVKGKVTFDGKPLANAAVMLIPQTPGAREATAFSDTEGVFELSTDRPKDGVLPGSYKVTVQYSEPVQVPSNLKSAEDVQNAMARAIATKKPTIVIPPIYARPDLTVLTHKVPDDGDMKLELQSTKR